MLDTIERTTPAGLPDKTRMAEMLSNLVKLLPELLLQMGSTSDAMVAYRRSLLRFSFCLNSHDLMHVMQTFAILLLYSGIEALPASSGPFVEGVFTPKNNSEEGILLLMILLRIMKKEQGHFDSSTVVEHLSLALSTSDQLATLAHQYEALLPGTMSRPDRWYSLALCYAGVGEGSIALELLRKSLAPSEKPKHVPSLLLGAKLCAADSDLCSEGVGYCKQALLNLQRNVAYRARALHIQGVALGSQVQVASSDALKTRLHGEALATLQVSRPFF